MWSAEADTLKPDYVSSAFSKLLEDNGLRHIRFHDLRHSCISILACDPNLSMRQVQDYARHASYVTTANVYSHIRDKQTGMSLATITNRIDCTL